MLLVFDPLPPSLSFSAQVTHFPHPLAERPSHFLRAVLIFEPERLLSPPARRSRFQVEGRGRVFLFLALTFPLRRRGFFARGVRFFLVSLSPSKLEILSFPPFLCSGASLVCEGKFLSLSTPGCSTPFCVFAFLSGCHTSLSGLPTPLCKPAYADYFFFPPFLTRLGGWFPPLFADLRGVAIVFSLAPNGWRLLGTARSSHRDAAPG